MDAVAVENDPKAEWLKRVLGLDIAGEPQAGDGPSADDLRGELNALGIEIRNHQDTKEIADLAKRLREGIAALKSGDLGAAQAAAGEIGADLARLLSASRGKTAPDGVTLRAVAAASIDWQRALATADDEIASLKDAVLAAAEADEELDDEDIDEIAGQLDELDDIPLALAELTPALRDLADADGPAREEALRELLGEVAEKRSYLKSDDWVSVLADAGVAQVSFVDACLGVLDELEAAAKAS